LLLVFWAITVLRRKDAYGLWTFYFVFTLFVIWGGVSLLWTRDVSQGILEFLDYSLFVMFTVIFVDVIRSKNRLKKTSYAYILGAIILILIEVRMNMLINFQSGVDRLGWYLTGPNVFAYQILVSVPLAWFLVFDRIEDRISAKLLVLAYLLFATYAILVSRSRARIGILALVIILGLVLDSRSVANRKYILPVVGAITAVSFVVRESILSRFDGVVAQITSGQLQGSLQARFELYAAAYEYVLSNPIRGAGLGSVREVLQGVESSYSLVSVELGVVGVLLFVTLLAYLLKGTLRRDGHPHMELYILLIVIFGSFFDPVINFLETWVILAIALVWNGSIRGDSESSS
jgi:O-antigen ligase